MDSKWRKMFDYDKAYGGLVERLMTSNKSATCVGQQYPSIRVLGISENVSDNTKHFMCECHVWKPERLSEKYKFRIW